MLNNYFWSKVFDHRVVGVSPASDLLGGDTKDLDDGLASLLDGLHVAVPELDHDPVFGLPLNEWLALFVLGQNSGFDLLHLLFGAVDGLQVVGFVAKFETVVQQHLQLVGADVKKLVFVFHGVGISWWLVVVFKYRYPTLLRDLYARSRDGAAGL